MLRVIDMSVKINKVQILHSINFHVNEAEIVSIIGANGAGKSTLLNTIAGLYSPFEGKIIFDNEPINELSAHGVIKKGLTLVPEGRQIFYNNTVKENLELGAYIHYSRDEQEIESNITRILDMFPALKNNYNNLGGNLSDGEQQMLAVGRALMSNPRIMLIDELSKGLTPLIMDEVIEVLLEINNHLDTILILAEQNFDTVLSLSDRMYVLHQGKIVSDSINDENRSNPTIKSIQLDVNN